MLVHIHHEGQDDQHSTDIGSYNDKAYVMLRKFINGDYENSKFTENEHKVFKSHYDWIKNLG